MAFNKEVFKDLINSLDVNRGHYFKIVYFKTVFSYIKLLDDNDYEEFFNSDAMYYVCEHFFHNKENCISFCINKEIWDELTIHIPNDSSMNPNEREVMNEITFKKNLTKAILNINNKTKLKSILNFLINGEGDPTIRYGWMSYVPSDRLTNYIDMDLIYKSGNKKIKTILMELKLKK